MLAEDFFLRLCADLDSSLRQDEWDDYSAIRVSAMLRQLLLDGSNSIIHQANRNVRSRLRFRVIARQSNTVEFLRKAGLPVPSTVYSAIHPYETHGDEVTLDNLLSMSVLWVESEWFSVRDIVKCAANCLGGVHLDRPSEGDRLAVLIQESDRLRLDGVSVISRALRDIAVVALEGTLPLRQELVRRHKT